MATIFAQKTLSRRFFEQPLSYGDDLLLRKTWARRAGRG